MTTFEPTGRRERKKAATRQALADAAFELFVSRGFDSVSVKEVADRADVSTTTLFKYFASKESLVFDRSDDFESELIAAVRDRQAGQSLLESLRAHALQTWAPISEDPRLRQLATLVESTPSLREYSERTWLRHADSLSLAIADELGRPSDDLAARSLARFVLEIPTVIRGRSDPRESIDQVFGFLANGWNASVRH